MTYTEKVLEEFDEKFGALLDMLEKLYGGNPEEMTTFKEALKSFLSTSIHQAIAEERERVWAEIKNMGDGVVMENGLVNVTSTPDKSTEYEMPMVKETMEALEKLTIINK